MCGIAGIIAASPELASTQRIQRMTDAIAHRGPDGEAGWLSANGRVALGHRRLAIIDLRDCAAQPMHYADRYSIVYNGEIYNYRELRDTLQQKGFLFQTASDTEVILAAYAAWGEGCLAHFDGMFAFAIWDEQEQTLFAARDRFGEKPFYYYQDETQLVFASEMKALWAAGVPKAMRKDMLFNYLTLGYVQNPHQPGDTFYQHIHKLPARSFLRYDLRRHSLTITPYWSLDPAMIDTSLTEEAAAEKLGALLQQSVSRRLRSDVSVGTSLSGGLDSSSILACITREPHTAFKTFSAIFPGFRQDESRQIARTTETFGVKNYQVQPDVDSFLQHFTRVCLQQEEPFQSASIVAQYEVFGLAKTKGVTVLLDGQGADETMAGYTKYYEWYWRELYRYNKKLLKQELAQSPGADHWDWKHKLRAQWPSLANAQLVRMRKKQQLGQADLSPDLVQSFGISHYDSPVTPSLNSVLYYNTFINGLEELLQYADRNSMAHGREVRLPFLQHELVQFIFSLPPGFKIREGYTKWLLRKRMSKVLPDDIVWRKDKVGFEPPQKSWMQDERVAALVQEAKKVLVTEGVLKAGVLDKKIKPQDSHAAENFDWRYLVAGTLLR